MKWIAIGATVLVAIPIVLTMTVAAVATSCMTDPATCAAPAAAHAPATPGDRPTNTTAVAAADLTALGEAIGGGVPSYSILRDRSAYGTGWGGPSVNLLAPK